MEDQEKLYGLMAVAEEQQKSVKAAITGLAQERAALISAINSIKDTSGSLQKGTSDAASRAVHESIVEAPKVATAALKRATDALDTATKQVNGAGAWLTFKVGLSVAIIGLVMVAAWYGLGRYMLHDLQNLHAETVEMQRNVAALEKRGGKVKIETCGKSSRLCVRVDKSNAYGDTKDYFVLKGY